MINKRQVISFFLLRFSKGIVFNQISKPNTQCVLKNIKMKADIAMRAHNLKALYSVPTQKFSKNLEKLAKL